MPIDNLNYQPIFENASFKNIAHLKLYEWAGSQLPGGWVVDMGSEMGFGLSLLERADRKVIGLEIRFDELYFSRSTINLRQSIHHICADVTALPISKHYCSGMCMLNVLHLFPSPAIVLDECRRVLKANHPLVIAVPTDYNLPDAWRIPNEKEHLRGLLEEVFSKVEISQTDHRDEAPRIYHDKKHHGWITAVCK